MKWCKKNFKNLILSYYWFVCLLIITNWTPYLNIYFYYVLLQPTGHLT